MDPLTLAFAGGSSLLSGLFGSSEADRTQQANEQANQQNFYLAEQERQDAIRAAQQARQDKQAELLQQQLGTTDSQGNHTHFIDGQGWVTDLSATGKQQQDQANELQQEQGNEKLNELNKDVPLQREQLQKQFQSQSQAGSQSDALMRMFHDAIIKGKSPSTGNLQYGAAAQGINDAYNQETEDAARTAVRSGTPNSGVLLAALAKGRAKDLSAASSQAYQSGREQSTNDYNSNLSNLSNLQSAFAQQASAPLGQAYQAASTTYQPASSGDLSTLQGAMSGLQQNDGDQGIIQANEQKGGRLDYQQPNYALANSFASFGNILANSGKKNSSLSNAFANYGSF